VTRPAPRAPGISALLLGAAATATLLVAAWLVFTALTILPARDPGHVRTWLCIAAGFAGFALVSVAALAPWRGATGARGTAGVLGVPAAGLGLGTLVRQLKGATGGHFEGYLVLMAIVLTAHGLIALANALMPPATPPR
jgi:hypothetical protein